MQPTLFDKLEPETFQDRLTAALQRLLEPENMAMEFRHTWKTLTTPGGRVIPKITASARRTSGNDFFGWPTPAVQNADGGENPAGNVGEYFTLQTAAGLTAWPTPMAGSPGTEEYSPAGNTDSSRKTIALVSPRATPTQRDWKSGDASKATMERNVRPLNEQAVNLVGPISAPSPVETASPAESPPKRKVLNPFFSAWLMGFPEAWTIAGLSSMQLPVSRLRKASAAVPPCSEESETQLSRKSRQRS